jgi:phosphoglycerate dehydrogenase-like enzyme
MLCTHKVSAAEEQQIRSAGKNVDFVVVGSRAELKAKIADAEAIFGPVDADSLAAAKKLKWVQHTAAGVEVLPKELMEHPSVLTNMQRVYAPVIAESALGMALSPARGLVQDAFQTSARKWGPGSVPLVDLYHKTIGLVGLRHRN